MKHYLLVTIDTKDKIYFDIKETVIRALKNRFVEGIDVTVKNLTED